MSSEEHKSINTQRSKIASYRVFSPSRNKNLNQKPFSGLSQEIVILWKMNKEDSSLSFRLVRCPKAEIFAEMFRAKLQSLVWCRHVGEPQWDTNMASGK